jgi:hypothetical protein
MNHGLRYTPNCGPKSTANLPCAVVHRNRLFGAVSIERPFTMRIRGASSIPWNATHDLRDNIVLVVSFWSHVKKTGGCWLWMGAKYRNGYGVFGWRNKRNITAHRAAYVLTHGGIPDGMDICHTCDNRGCVNPSHLWAGTPTDNMRDCKKKGRTARGERNGQAKITEREMCLIRSERARGVLLTDLATKYKLTFQQISSIANRKTWKHIA